MKTSTFPYKTSLSFGPLLRYLEERSVSGKKSISKTARGILEEVHACPALCADPIDGSTIEKHQEMVDSLMSAVFSPVALEREISAALYPFQLQPFFYTERWEEIVGQEDAENGLFKNSSSQFHRDKYLYANSLILSKVFGKGVHTTGNKIHPVKEKATGLNKYYKSYFNADFSELIVHREPPQLSDDVLAILADNLGDQVLWDKYIPHDMVEFRGFIVISLNDVTQNEVISSLKYDLLRKDAIISREHFKQVEHKIRELYGLPDLSVGIVSFDEDGEGGQTQPPKIWNSIVTEQEIKNVVCSADNGKEAFEGCIYHNMMTFKQAQAVPDLEDFKNPSPIERLLLKKNIKSILVAPLIYEGKCLGGLEIGSPRKGDFTLSSILMLQEVLPVFSLAAKRSLEELENQVQAVIKEQYTAIHPAVEWRFAHAAISKINKERSGEMAENEPIVFDNVYPLYGQADVRNSSVERNVSIQADLTEQLNLARSVINIANERQDLLIVKEIVQRIDDCLGNIEHGIGSGDEMSILHFVKNEIEPLFKYFFNAGLLQKKDYDRYFKALHPEVGIVYKKRKAFEDSLTMINELISHLIEEEQVGAQKAFPHYFEKYKTDGVEYNIYMGDAIAPNRTFDKIYLNNLRLWQLRMTCQIAAETEALKPKLPIPLSTTHLILINSTPIAIRFREDEKQFDVDGAYNIRYEIIKKRIDKSYIKGTNERLTQPGKIAIVYTQANETREYRRYIEYLQKNNLLKEEIEDVELEALQGMNGLRALRVSVNLEACEARKAKKFAEKVIKEVYKAESAVETEKVS